MRDPGNEVAIETMFYQIFQHFDGRRKCGETRSVMFSILYNAHIDIFRENYSRKCHHQIADCITEATPVLGPFLPATDSFMAVYCATTPAPSKKKKVNSNISVEAATFSELASIGRNSAYKV